MRKLSDTLNRLAEFRAITSHKTGGHGVDRLSDLPEFGSNPGALRARVYMPEGLPEAAPLVVV
nr:hypothetical protein [Pseudaminobacter sp.]